VTKSIPKESIVVATDHRGVREHAAIVEFLRKRGIKVVSCPHGGEADSYADVARKACYQIDKGLADSAVLIDQFGSAVASVANMFFGIVAMTASSPHMAYEITRKCNPDVLCIPAEDKDGKTVSSKEAVAIVKTWLDTEFLQDVPPQDRAKYEGRDDENRRLHLGIIDGLVSGHRRSPPRQHEQLPSGTSARPSTDMLGHYDECFEDGG